MLDVSCFKVRVVVDKGLYGFGMKKVLDKKGKLLTEISLNQIKKLIKNGTISEGMIPKVKTCIDAVKKGVKAAFILNGKLPHAILLEMFTESGVGTLITK